MTSISGTIAARVQFYCSVVDAASGSTDENAPAGCIIPRLRWPKSHRPHRRSKGHRARSTTCCREEAVPTAMFRQRRASTIDRCRGVSSCRRNDVPTMLLVHTRCEHRESSRLALEIVRFLATQDAPHPPPNPCATAAASSPRSRRDMLGAGQPACSKKREPPQGKPVASRKEAGCQTERLRSRGCRRV